MVRALRCSLLSTLRRLTHIVCPLLLVALSTSLDRRGARTRQVAALFSFSSWLTIASLFICSCTFYRESRAPVPYKIQGPDGAMVINPGTTGMWGIVWKASRVGQRRSAWVGGACVLMALNALLF